MIATSKRSHKKHRLQITRRLLVILTALFSLIASYDMFSSHGAVVEEKELSIVFASTDCPPFSLRKTITDAIDRAQKSIYIAIYAIQDPMIIHHLKQAAESRHIPVVVFIDRDASSNARFLLGNNISVVEKKMKGLMHMKLLIVDESIVWYGTMNFTKSSLFTHGNIGCGIFSPKLARMCISFILAQTEKGPHNEPSAITLSTAETGGPEIFFSLHPKNAASSLEKLIEKIRSAKERVFVAMYTFTHHGLADALIEAKQRNVDVRVLCDRESSYQTSRVIYNRLKRAAIRIGVQKKPGLLHYKCAIIDSSFICGSSNWTKAAFSFNCETFSIIDNLPRPSADFLAEWWNRVELDSTLAPYAAVLNSTSVMNNNFYALN